MSDILDFDFFELISEELEEAKIKANLTPIQKKELVRLRDAKDVKGLESFTSNIKKTAITGVSKADVRPTRGSIVRQTAAQLHREKEAAMARIASGKAGPRERELWAENLDETRKPSNKKGNRTPKGEVEKAVKKSKALVPSEVLPPEKTSQKRLGGRNQKLLNGSDGQAKAHKGGTINLGGRVAGSDNSNQAGKPNSVAPKQLTAAPPTARSSNAPRPMSGKPIQIDDPTPTKPSVKPAAHNTPTEKPHMVDKNLPKNFSKNNVSVAGDSSPIRTQAVSNNKYAKNYSSTGNSFSSGSGKPGSDKPSLDTLGSRVKGAIKKGVSNFAAKISSFGKKKTEPVSQSYDTPSSRKSELDRPAIFRSQEKKAAADTASKATTTAPPEVKAPEINTSNSRQTATGHQTGFPINRSLHDMPNVTITPSAPARATKAAAGPKEPKVKEPKVTEPKVNSEPTTKPETPASKPEKPMVGDVQRQNQADDAARKADQKNKQASRNASDLIHAGKRGIEGGIQAARKLHNLAKAQKHIPVQRN